MKLLQQIKDASLNARKSANSNATFLVTLYAEAARVGKDNGQRDSTDEEVIAILKKFKDGANTIIEFATKRGGDNAQAQITQALTEIELIDAFLPRQLSSAELVAIINGYIVALPEVSQKSMGVIMGNLKRDYPGLYDGTLASTCVRGALREYH